MTTEAYPLAWPAGRKRTDYRERAKFDVTFARARDNIVGEVSRLAGRYPDPQIVISTNIALRRDGLPLAGQRQPEDPGVAVYFLYKKRQMSFACDRWEKIEHNMQAIAKKDAALKACVEAMQASTDQTVSTEQFFKMVDAAITKAEGAMK